MVAVGRIPKTIVVHALRGAKMDGFQDLEKTMGITADALKELATIGLKQAHGNELGDAMSFLYFGRFGNPG